VPRLPRHSTNYLDDLHANAKRAPKQQHGTHGELWRSVLAVADAALLHHQSGKARADRFQNLGLSNQNNRRL
jgi:hypothetical protein